MAQNSDARDFTPPTFSFALMGHLATGVVKVVAIALLLWGVGLTGWTASFPAGTAIVTASIVMIAIEFATTGVERIFVLRHRHPDPGSVPMTAIVAVLPVPISFLIGLLFAPGPSGALITMVVTTVVYWAALVALERPWVEGDSQADIRRKYEQTKAMTRDQFRSE
ncbi:hypothetical protein ACTXJK_12910 [Brachybacterium tyrofermentans]|uniref:hypothetical protein n=1 Tax=Brachybacterium tyrofermentans TaxID=47848 RepID=UPI003FD530BE